MPYNTRRKSLSLPSLGIQLPPSSRAHPANRSPPSAGPAPAAAPAPAEHPPSKKVKRSHPATSSSPTSISTSTSPTSIRLERARAPAAPRYEHTPPPSPGPPLDVRVDTQGINDDIVAGVIRQLERTGNKPQLVKELAAALCESLHVVESSANPQAIISSRLNAYLRRPWTALSPCPLAKTLVPTHPRRIYFYLTTAPHRPLPASSSESPLPSSRRGPVISPSLSSEEDQESRKRAALSPSPEVDLSAPDLDDADVDGHGPPTPAGSFSNRSSLARDGSQGLAGPGPAMGHSHRAASPPLEGDEREFTHTASVMQSKRSMSRDRNAEGDAVRMSTEDDSGEGRPAAADAEADESDEARHSAAAAALFGQPAQPQPLGPAVASGLSSPVVRAATGLHVVTSATGPRKAAGPSALMDVDGGPAEVERAAGLSWDVDMISPEKVELDELDDLLGEF
ncbi:MAG: hypothetical protein M1832_000966 [Thelocarpon impressellum]|nr:MAG: hypothetical protein M1832_000966 [Thelocarpon impressellum]